MVEKEAVIEKPSSDSNEQTETEKEESKQEESDILANIYGE